MPGQTAQLRNQLAEQLAADKVASDAQHAELTRAQALLEAKTEELGDMSALVQELKRVSAALQEERDKLAEQLAADKVASGAQHSKLIRAQALLEAKTNELGDMPALLQELKRVSAAQQEERDKLHDEGARGREELLRLTAAETETRGQFKAAREVSKGGRFVLRCMQATVRQIPTDTDRDSQRDRGQYTTPWLCVVC